MYKNLKSKTVGVGKDDFRSGGFLEQWNESLAARIYRRYFKKIPLIRSSALWGRRYIISFYIATVGTYFFRNRSVKYPLIQQRNFAENGAETMALLTKAVTLKTPEPLTFPASARHYLGAPCGVYEFPEIYVAKIKDGIVCGKTNLTLVEEGVLYHDLYDLMRDYTAEENNFRACIYPKSNSIRLLYNKDATCGATVIPVAASFVDSCSHNYAHWITEVLTRLILFCRDDRFKDVPIIVDEGLHANLMESLRAIVCPQRQIITLATWSGLTVERLYLTSVAGYIPFGRRTERLSGHSEGKFHPEAIQLIRTHMLGLSNLPAYEGALPEKICIKRTVDIRKVTNAVEIEQILVSRGFVMVEPEKMTFMEQVRLFGNAKVIVGSSGAGLANIIFAPRNAKIFILMSKQHNNIYWYWQSIAYAAGNTVCYILGELDGGKGGGIHADFKIDKDVLLSALDTCDDR